MKSALSLSIIYLVMVASAHTLNKNCAAHNRKSNIKTTIAQLREIEVPIQGAIYNTTDFGGGEWILHPEDHTSNDNTGTVIVTVSGLRYKRLLKDSTINITWFGADKTGMKDCADLVRKAQKIGNVFFPAGTYLMSAVDVVSNRKYYGEGMGKTIIKSAYTKNGVRDVFCVSTYDFDNSKHPNLNVENVVFSDMTLDFNFINGWVNFFSVIFFKGKPGNFIKNITIDQVEFIDNAKMVHPHLLGLSGRDAWCINLSSYADSTVNVVVKNCSSKAESHQFVGGGGSFLKGVKVLNNYILRPDANAVAFTTVSTQPVTFLDFEVTGNTIIDAYSSAILFGHDPAPEKRSVSVQTFSNLKVLNNNITISDYTVYNTIFRKTDSYPYVINLSAGEPYMQDVLIKNNNITVESKYSGGNICLGKLQTFSYNRPATNLINSFKQPEPGSLVTIKVRQPVHMGQSAFQRNGYIAINTGGIYKVVSVKDSSVMVVLQKIGNYAPASKQIDEGNTVTFLGGTLSNISFINNNILSSRQLNLIMSGVIDNLTFEGNENTNILIKYPNTLVRSSTISNNKNFHFIKSAGYFNGKLIGNQPNNTQTSSTINILKSVSQLTGFEEKADIKTN